MSTAIAAWGNSAAVRIPAIKLRQAGLTKGDPVQIDVNERGNLELYASTEHRRGARRQLVGFDELFAGYRGTRLDVGDPWGNNELIGAEREAWS